MWLRMICLYLRHLSSLLSEEPPSVFIEQPPNHVLVPTGIGLWRMRPWGLLGGLAVAGAAVYFGILQVAAELFGGSQYHLYGMGALAMPLAGTPLFEPTKWVGLLGWAIYPAVLGVYCARRLWRK